MPPYVNSADQSGAVPFLDIANWYILAGAQYNPQVLADLSAAQIASQLGDPSSPVAQAIDGSAQVIIAALNQVLHDRSPRYEHRAYPAAETRPSVLTTQAQQPSRIRRRPPSDLAVQPGDQRAQRGDLAAYGCPSGSPSSQSARPARRYRTG